ncbi:MAG: glutathione S-transferase family protein [Phenylobacterium sp.]|jgi:glutathione S-transferase|uniref:glutathione S-transferase family protein n=1 Tax=Phenylobacterium sp. TaxID=1871053 RepID=UPI002A36A0D4|nr:glutathione S-transferase family protein [Phenylobacterium sp.]MDX9999550.1 glutathione S-transferase family protein [Phenylobacterium sp.]
MSRAALAPSDTPAAVPRIWARRSSSSAQKVYWTLEELGLPYEQIDAGRSFGVVDTPEYRAKNPNGLVPTLEEPDGFTLWESNAIIRYLGGRHGAPHFWPDDVRVRADADRWMEWANSTLLPAVNPIFARLVLRHGGEADAEFVAAQVARSKTAFAILSDRLADRPFVAGDHLTFGDIPLGMIVNRWFKLPIERPELPVISAYYARLQQREPYVRNVVNAPPVI